MVVQLIGRILLIGALVASAAESTLQSAPRDVIAPAAEFVASPLKANTLQLTDNVLANLAAHQPPDIRSLFSFDTKSAASNANCKLFPGDADWPGKPVWSIFNLLTGNALIETVPIGSVCYPNSGVYSASACTALLAAWTKSDTQ